MAPNNVNRHLTKAEPGFWDNEPEAESLPASDPRSAWNQVVITTICGHQNCVPGHDCYEWKGISA